TSTYSANQRAMFCGSVTIDHTVSIGASITTSRSMLSEIISVLLILGATIGCEEDSRTCNRWLHQSLPARLLGAYPSDRSAREAKPPPRLNPGATGRVDPIRNR